MSIIYLLHQLYIHYINPYIHYINYISIILINISIMSSIYPLFISPEQYIDSKEVAQNKFSNKQGKNKDRERFVDYA